jgi:glutamyl-tRNA synthetase
MVQPFLAAQGAIRLDTERLTQGCALFKDRCSTLVELGWHCWCRARRQCIDLQIHVTGGSPCAGQTGDALASCWWNKAAITAVIKRSTAGYRPENAAARHAGAGARHGAPQTPSLDALALMSRNDVVTRLKV